MCPVHFPFYLWFYVVVFVLWAIWLLIQHVTKMEIELTSIELNYIHCCCASIDLSFQISQAQVLKFECCPVGKCYQRLIKQRCNWITEGLPLGNFDEDGN
jgi:hypothetical protein